MGHLWLIGMMGTGKTTVGTLLASRRGVPLYDTDQLVETRSDRTIVDLFAAEGERAFRDMEAGAVVEIASQPPGVVATGGGVILRAENTRSMLRSGTVVLLTAAPETIVRRLETVQDRPLLAVGDRLAEVQDLLETRRRAYEEASQIVIETDEIDPATVADRIEDRCDAM